MRPSADDDSCRKKAKSVEWMVHRPTADNGTVIRFIVQQRASGVIGDSIGARGFDLI